MSKNFELLAQLEREFGSAAAPSAEAVFPSLPTASSLSQATPAADQELNRMVQRVFFSTAHPACRHVMFCGIESANGSSSVVARAARALAAKANEKVCLVDANPSEGGVSGVFGIPPKPSGEQNGTLVESCVCLAPRLWLLRWSDAHGASVAASDLRAAVAELQREFGFLLVDVPGCLFNDDAMMWAPIADATVLIVEAQASHRAAATQAKQRLESVGAHLAGTVLNNMSHPVPQALYDRL